MSICLGARSNAPSRLMKPHLLVVSTALTLSGATVALSLEASAQNAAPMVWTTAFRGPDMCLDVVNGGAFDGFTILQQCGNFSGQHWFARPAASGWMEFTTEWRGPAMCLDVVNGGEYDTLTRLQPCENRTGQHWRIAPGGDGTLRLTTEFRGEGMCLDVVNGGAWDRLTRLEPCEGRTGQQWSSRNAL